MDAAKKWYKKHQELKPIEELQHKVFRAAKVKMEEVGEEGKQPASSSPSRESKRGHHCWKRSLGAGHLEEAHGELSAQGQEKTAVLSALEIPAEANTIGDVSRGQL